MLTGSINPQTLSPMFKPEDPAGFVSSPWIPPLSFGKPLMNVLPAPPLFRRFFPEKLNSWQKSYVNYRSLKCLSGKNSLVKDSEIVFQVSSQFCSCASPEFVNIPLTIRGREPEISIARTSRTALKISGNARIPADALLVSVYCGGSWAMGRDPSMQLPLKFRL